LGQITKTSPQGTIEHPFNPGELAIGAQGTFFARVTDTNPKLMTEIMVEASKHKGTSLIEFLQNCVIFNNKTHKLITARETKDENQIHLKAGEPMIFGKERDKGIILDGTKLKVVKLGENGYTEKDLLVHDPHESDPGIHMMLAKMAPPELPAAIGVIRSVDHLTYEEQVEAIVKHEKEVSSIHTVNDLLNSGKTWEI
jgi:2-oxoglutarate ferredoxin oxidoreductase subunit beta